MKAVLYPFMLLAGCGLVLSFVVHGMALAGVRIPGGGLVWVLHAGIFVVFLPTVFVFNQMTRHVSRKDGWKVALAGCPVWMRRAGGVLFAYAILNFMLFMVNTATQPKEPKKSKMSETPLAVIRGFSGHWMLFYGAAFAVLYSMIHAPGPARERKCPLGHTVAPEARFCSECGHDLSSEKDLTSGT